MTATCATSAKQNATTRPGITHSTRPMAIRPAAGTIVASSGPARRSTSIQVSTQPAAPPVSRSATATVIAALISGTATPKASVDTSVASTPRNQRVIRPGPSASAGHVGEPGLVLVLQARDGGGVGVVLVGVGQRVPGRVGGARQRGDLRGRAGGQLGAQDRRHHARLRERRRHEQQRADQQQGPRVPAVQPERLDEEVGQAFLGGWLVGRGRIRLVGHGWCSRPAREHISIVEARVTKVEGRKVE